MIMSTTETPATPEASDAKRTLSSGRLYLWLGVGLPILTLVAVFVILRWAPSPVETALVVGSILLIGLAVVGYLGSQSGVVAPFIAVALLLPYLLGAVVAYGGAQRAEAELSALFSDLGVSEGGDMDTDAPGEGMAEGGEPPMEEEMSSVPFGEPGYFEGYEVTINSVECGVDSIPKAAENPEYWESDNAPEFIAATPPEGKSFCIVHSTWRNESGQPGTRSSYDTITGLIGTDGNQYGMAGDDELISGNLTRTKGGYQEDTLNPGDSADIYSVFSVPQGVEPETLVAEGFSFDSTEVVYFDARPTQGAVEGGALSNPRSAEDFNALLKCDSFEAVEVSDGPADEQYTCVLGRGFEVSVMRIPVVVARDLAPSMAASGMFSVVVDSGWLLASRDGQPLEALVEVTGDELIEP
jgi:hypothetical protein